MGLGRARWHGTQGLPPPFRRPLCPSCRVGFAPIPTKSGESRAERAGRPGPAHRGQRRRELGANSYEVLVPRSPMGACIHAPWPWPRGDQKYIYIYRQTATKPRYYIRGIEITAISGLGRFGVGGWPRPRLRAPSSCRPHGPRSCQLARYPRTTPHHFDGLSARPRASVSRRSPRNRALRGHRAGFLGVGSGGDQGQRRPRAGHSRRLWERLWGGVSNWARTPTGF